MVSTLIKEFAKEKIFRLGSDKSQKMPFPLTRITRLVNSKGQAQGVLLPQNVWEDLIESMEYADPKFWKEIEISRKTPRIPSARIEKELGLSS